MNSVLSYTMFPTDMVAAFQLLPGENETQWENRLGITQDKDWAGPASSVAHSKPWTT